MVSSTKKIVAIVGPTASGKTGLALQVAKNFSGEVICADSRTVYKLMDIGTAKPTLQERREVSHHCLDLVNPDESYSAGMFKKDAALAISEIKTRGNLPIIAGGTGLYAYGLIYDYKFPVGADNAFRRKLNSLDPEELRQKLKKIDPEVYDKIDLKNPRRIIRAIETAGEKRSQSMALPKNIILVGLFPGFDKLNKQIALRTEHMIENGLEKETRDLMKYFSTDLQSLRSIGYKEIVDYINRRTTLDEAMRLISLHTLQLSKRQMTWYKRNKDITWFSSINEAYSYVSKQLD